MQSLLNSPLLQHPIDASSTLSTPDLSAFGDSSPTFGLEDLEALSQLFGGDKVPELDTSDGSLDFTEEDEVDKARLSYEEVKKENDVLKKAQREMQDEINRLRQQIMELTNIQDAFIAGPLNASSMTNALGLDTSCSNTNCSAQTVKTPTKTLSSSLAATTTGYLTPAETPTGSPGILTRPVPQPHMLSPLPSSLDPLPSVTFSIWDETTHAPASSQLSFPAHTASPAMNKATALFPSYIAKPCTATLAKPTMSNHLARRRPSPPEQPISRTMLFRKRHAEEDLSSQRPLKKQKGKQRYSRKNDPYAAIFSFPTSSSVPKGAQMRFYGNHVTVAGEQRYSR